MKHCPTCGSSYTDDTLVYCLQDGATLSHSGEQSNPLSMVATLRDDTDLGEETRGGINNSSAPTVEISAGALPTTLYQDARPTAPVTGGGAAPPTASAATQPTGNTSRLILMTVLVTLLLLAVGSVGAWMLFRGDGRWRERRAARENSNGALPGNSPAASNTSNASQPGNQTRGDNRPDRGGRWFVILASFPKEELSRANERLEVVRRQGFDARIMLSDDYPNFKSGLWLIGMGPYTRNQADEALEQARPKIKDAYTKSGW
jgi:hypothetical protein